MQHVSPMPPLQSTSEIRGRPNLILRGIAVHSGIVCMTCFLVAVAMGSNIWPIAGIFWSVLTLPIAVISGACFGLVARRMAPQFAMPMLIATGVALAIIVAIVMANNR